MRYRSIYKDISIVTVGKVNCDICNPLNLYKRRIISQEELSSINDKDMRVGADVVSFKTSTFEFYCDDKRMQVRSEDCSRSDQLSEVSLNILRLSETTPTAIGINATFRFMLDETSFLMFCNKCSPMAAFVPMAENALLVDLTFLDWNHNVKDGNPMLAYNIKRLPDDINNQKVIQMSVNNHIEVRDGMNTVLYYLAETSSFHSRFFDRCQQFIDNIQ